VISFFSLLLTIGMTLYLAFMYESSALLLMVYLEAAFFVVSFFSLTHRRIRLKVLLEVPIDISDPAKENLVRLCVENKSGVVLSRLEAKMTVKDVINGKSETYHMQLSDLPKGESNMIRNVVFGQAGKYAITLKNVRVYDRTGLLYMNRRMRQTRYIHVAPPYYDVPVRLTMATKNFYGEADVYDEKQPGYDQSETFQIRAYQRGDRLQNVHWKLTAKQEELMVKENALPNCCPVILFLELFGGTFGRKRKEWLPFLSAAASISFSMMDAGCPHYVVWYDRLREDIVRVRVDNEESMFRFLGMLMRIDWEKPKEELKQRYRDKYGREPYVWALSLDRTLVLKKEDYVLAKLSAKHLEESLAKTELLL